MWHLQVCAHYLGQRVLKISYYEHPFLRIVGLLHFWVYLALMVLAVLSLFAGMSQSKEYSELVWPLDLLVVVVWVLWGISLFGSMAVRREQTVYISLWYFMATFVAIATLYIFNNLSIHVDEYTLEVRETKRGMEELTSDIPNN